jgi:transposase
MPAAHRAHLEWTPSKLVAWGASVGPSVAELIETMLCTRPHPEHGYRACLGLRRLAKRYGPERLSAACQRALAIHAASYTSVHSILKNGLDQVPVVGDPPPPNVVPLVHPNLRGTAYYQQVLLEVGSC